MEALQNVVSSLLGVYKNGLPFAVFAFIPLLPIILDLWINQKAGIRKNGDIVAVCCGDMRVYRVFAIFGGSSSFTFGLHWAVLSYLFGMLHWEIAPIFGHLVNVTAILAQTFAAYATLQFMATIVQMFMYGGGLYVYKDDFENVRWIILKAHLDACGWTTGWSPFFIAYYLPKTSRVITFRDVLTRIDWVVSLPAMIFLNIISLIMLQKVTVPQIKHVDKTIAH